MTTLDGSSAFSTIVLTNDIIGQSNVLLCCSNGLLRVKMERGLDIPSSDTDAKPKQKSPERATNSNGGLGSNA
eukprot:CAMPEP_0201971366 /NCGR_PEP_ID=MMETSP0904-20121228/36659_1 /ASSEMBLY_ACC=CAM_ASM_000553 /TAXON_ID=420261 /ORGANISM="Thalassiosira antarctica, Strain CCMP982" /LENGTH=72 /DNA_ID=CAMNT_0048520751 /DNA_START=49 /DNA_END=267 /DNA_ORIENTATION=-